MYPSYPYTTQVQPVVPGYQMYPGQFAPSPFMCPQYPYPTYGIQQPVVPVQPATPVQPVVPPTQVMPQTFAGQPGMFRNKR